MPIVRAPRSRATCEMIGAALSIPVVDLDGDGDLDIVVSGKWGGPVWFENKAK